MYVEAGLRVLMCIKQVKLRVWFQPSHNVHSATKVSDVVVGMFEFVE